MPVGETQDVLRALSDGLFMGDEQDRLALGVELCEEPEDLLGRLGVEVSRRLVREDQRGIIEERTGDGGAVLLAPGKASAWPWSER